MRATRGHLLAQGEGRVGDREQREVYVLGAGGRMGNGNCLRLSLNM